MLRQGHFYTRNIDMTWKTFVRESQDVPDVSPEKWEQRLGFEGSEAREAYEEIINQPTEEQKSCKQRKPAGQKTVSPKSADEKAKKCSETKVSINSILKAIEQKDLKFLLKHVTRDNVNLTDDFGWTPLMSAAYCGHVDIIQFLLSLGASKEAREKSGLTAAQLALKKNYLNIVALLRKKTGPSSSKVLCQTQDASSQTRPELLETKCNGTVLNSRDNVNDKTEENTGFYCDICKVNFHQTTLKKHETSTLHIFNTKPKLPNAMYGISKQNKGYQMLLNTGWDEQVGLGPFGKGIKYPIKTCLKNDRKGLGQPNEKEYKVTHFKPGDPAAVNDSKNTKQKCLKKKDREKLLNREVRKERVLRIALS